MRQDFGVRGRTKIGVAILDKLLLERLIIFNHAIVNERESAARIDMWVRIFVGHFAVCRPARVANSERTRWWVLRDQLAQRSNTPCAFTDLDIVTSIDNGHAGRVVAPVFEPSQTVQQNRRGLSPPDVSDNPAHPVCSVMSA